jgi:hypothetical protein
MAVLALLALWTVAAACARLPGLQDRLLPGRRRSERALWFASPYPPVQCQTFAPVAVGATAFGQCKIPSASSDAAGGRRLPAAYFAGEGPGPPVGTGLGPSTDKSSHGVGSPDAAVARSTNRTISRRIRERNCPHDDCGPRLGGWIGRRTYFRPRAPPGGKDRHDPYLRVKSLSKVLIAPGPGLTM